MDCSSPVIDGNYFQMWTEAKNPAKRRPNQGLSLASISRRLQGPARVGDIGEEGWREREEEGRRRWQENVRSGRYGSIGGSSISAMVSEKSWNSRFQDHGTERGDSDCRAGVDESPTDLSFSETGSPDETSTPDRGESLEDSGEEPGSKTWTETETEEETRSNTERETESEGQGGEKEEEEEEEEEGSEISEMESGSETEVEEMRKRGSEEGADRSSGRSRRGNEERGRGDKRATSANSASAVRRSRRRGRRRGGANMETGGVRTTPEEEPSSGDSETTSARTRASTVSGHPGVTTPKPRPRTSPRCSSSSRRTIEEETEEEGEESGEDEAPESKGASGLAKSGQASSSSSLGRLGEGASDDLSPIAEDNEEEEEEEKEIRHGRPATTQDGGEEEEEEEEVGAGSEKDRADRRCR